MGTVVGSNISGEYDVARGLALYDPAGDLRHALARTVDQAGSRLADAGARILASVTPSRPS